MLCVKMNLGKLTYVSESPGHGTSIGQSISLSSHVRDKSNTAYIAILSL